MGLADSYVGNDGRRYRNPCTSKTNRPKERWPNEQAAWFVVELVARGEHRARGVKATMYPYRCPKCEGWHLSTCRTDAQLRLHAEGVAALQRDRAERNLAKSTQKRPQQ